ncbi:MAG: hypothetical protein WCW52_04945 [Elusimicrobiales bacterium]
MQGIYPQVRSGNTRRLALIGAGGFLLSFISSFFIVFSCSLFLKTLGATALPGYYIVLNLLSAFLGACLFARDSSGVAGLRISNALLAAFCLAAGCVYSPGNKPLIFTAYLAVMLFQIYSLIFYWNLICHSLSMSEIKRFTGGITVWIMLGSIIAGFAVKPAMYIFSEREIFLLGAALILLFTFTLEALSAGFGLKKEREAPPMRKPALRELLGADLPGLLGFFTFGFCVIRYLAEYQFSLGAAQRFLGARELSGFLGELHAVTSCAILLWQTVFAGRFFGVWPAAVSYWVIAAVCLVLSASVSVRPEFALLAAFNYSAIFFTKTLKSQAQVVFLKAVPAGARSRANFLLGGIAQSVSVAAAGLLILFLNHFGFRLRAFFIIAFLLSVLLVLVSARLNKAYIHMLLRSISPDFLIRSGGLNLFSGLTSRRGAWKTRNRRLYILNALETLKTGGAPLALVNALKTLSNLDSADSVASIAPFMRHPNAWVKSAAILAVLRLAREPAQASRAREALSEMAASAGSFTRALAASTGKKLELKMFDPYLETFLDDEDLEVRRGALVAAARLETPSLIPVFKRMELKAENVSLRPLLARALSRARGFDSRLLASLEKLPDKYRARARHILLFISGEGPFSLAVRALTRLDPPLAVIVLKVLRDHGGNSRVLAVLRACMADKRFSLEPVIAASVGSRPVAATMHNIFDDLAAHCPRQEVYADLSAFLESGPGGRKEKEKTEKLFSLVLNYVLGWKTGEEVRAKLMGRGETGELAREIIESSVQDARIKELVYKLLRSQPSAA